MVLLPAFDCINNSVLILYHQGCTDGLVSAVIALKYYIERNYHVRLYSIVAGNLPIDLLLSSYPSNLIIRLVDLSITMDEYGLLASHFNDLAILDHHETTYKSCIENKADIFKHSLNTIGLPEGILYQYNKLYYSLERSGASLAWEYWYPNDPVPDLVRYVQDRDTWKFKLPNSREINQGIIKLIGFQFDRLNNVIDSLKSLLGVDNIKLDSIYDKRIINKIPKLGPYMQLLISSDLTKFKEIGEIAIKDIECCIKRLAAGAEIINWHKYKVFMVQSNLYISELANYLYNLVDKENNYLCDFVLVWRYENKICHVSLRSLNGVGTNVAEIAQMYKGGGHKHAAGFKVTLEYMIEILKGR